MVCYRAFRNDDPPGLAEVWNDAFNARGAVHLRHSSPLERFAFAKPYFDPDGLIVAEENGRCVGFCHAAFGPSEDGARLDREKGVVCLIGVRQSHRRQGIGTELLRRAEAYLSDNGAVQPFAGQMTPMNPMYFGIYGGSDLPGFLESDVAAAPFLAASGYLPVATRLVFQRPLDRPLHVVDLRFAMLRRHMEVQAVPKLGVDSWWQECSLGPVELIEFRLVEKSTSAILATATAWEMEGFSWRWGLPAVGLLSVVVQPERRKQGFAKYLMTCILHHLKDQFFGLVDVQAAPTDDAAIGLLQGLGFEAVDRGHLYQRTPTR